MKKVIAEFTRYTNACFVWLRIGRPLLARRSGQLGNAFAFGLAIVAMAYGIGPISGCHVIPAVSFGAFIAGRMSMPEMLQYWGAQFAGALAGAALLLLIASGAADYDLAANGLGQNGWGADYLGEYSIGAALIFEIVMTALFLIVILGATGEGAPAAFAGLAIGLTLTAIHIVGIQVTGVSVNPARSFGPAVLVGGKAITQLWLFIVAPLIGAGIAGMLYKMKILGSVKSQ